LDYKIIHSLEETSKVLHLLALFGGYDAGDNAKVSVKRGVKSFDFAIKNV